jgi:hypothetical protein
MLLPDMKVVQYYLKDKKHSAVQQLKSMIAKVFDHYTDTLVDSFKEETGNSIFEVDTYEHRDNVDGKPMIRINFLNDSKVHVYHGIRAQYIHAMYANLWPYLDKQAKFKIEAE